MGIATKDLFMYKARFYLVNAITVYRLLSAFVLLYLIANENTLLFKWLLALSFFTDAIDGYLARRFHVVSVAGSRIDSIADDITVFMAVIGMQAFEATFTKTHLLIMLVLLGLYLLQILLAVFKYGRTTSFHTYLAKFAAVAQGIFFVLLFFLPQPPVLLFYAAASLTILDLLEEITMVVLIRKWQPDIKGLLWMDSRNKRRRKYYTEDRI